MKKAVKIIIGLCVAIIIALIAVPFLFQDKLVALIKDTINNNVNAKVEFADANLSLIKHFPKASIDLSNVLVTNYAPFEGDTLVYTEHITIDLKLNEIFKNASEQLNISSFAIDNILVNVLVDEKGRTNYDIAKKSDNTTSEETTSEASSFKLSLDSYAITNATVNYRDQQGKMTFGLFEFNHSGSGDFSAKTSELSTETSTLVSFTMDDKNLIDHQKLDLTAVLGMDLEAMKFSFLKNEAHINHLPLIFDGFVKLNDTNQEVHVNFKTPSSDFKNFLALIPDAYAKNIEGVETSGNFSVEGHVDGMVSETSIPKLDIVMASNNASFKYPDLPKSVDHIYINTQIKNTTGNVKDTQVNVDKLSFKIDNNTFNGNAKVANITENPNINATLNGTVNLGDIDKVYPLGMKDDLSGIVTANLSTSFDMDAVQNNKYQRIKNNGTIELSAFEFSGEEVANPIKINEAKVDFNPTKITLTKFDAVTGKSDLNMTGNLENFLGFVLSDKNLQGTFNLNSSLFKVSDFMASSEDTTTSETEDTSEEEQLKIPAFLDCTVNAVAKEVHYDNLKLNNVKGTLVIKDQKATLKGVNGNMFGGSIALNGTVNTQDKAPVFDMDLGIKSFDISQSFTNIDMFKKLSPIASVLQGKLNTNLNLSGNLKDDFTPNLSSMSGKALAEILATNVSPQNSKALSLLNDKLSFVNLSDLNLKDLKTNVSFDKGKVTVKPFNIKYKDIDIQVAGAHSFDELMNYSATFNVPAKYLGSEVKGLLGKLDSKNQNMTVPVTANFSGSFTNPNVNTDLKSAVSNLTTQLVKQQKTKLVDKALGGLLGGKTKEDSSSETTTKATKTEKTVDKVKDVLGGIFGKKKTKEK